MTDQRTDLCTPWSLHFDRDGTEDYGIICDAEGNDLVASHLPGTKMPRWKDREFGEGCFWLPDEEGDKMPLLVRQMRVMTTAPQLLAMLKIAIATADPAKHKWVKEAHHAIAEATGERGPTREDGDGPPHLYRAAPRLYASLKACEAVLEKCDELVKAVDKLLKPQAELLTQIEDALGETVAAFCMARGEIAS
jgi:hypothetical protein